MNDLLSSEGSSAMWHPWRDRPGVRHPVARWNGNTGLTIDEQFSFHPASAQGLFDTVSRQKLYLYCEDILDQKSVPWTDDLLRFPPEQVVPYVSKSAGIAAIRLSNKRQSGFLLSAPSWCWHERLSERFLENVHLLFKLCGYQAVTLASLSERLLRSTLPESLHIHRPSMMLRRDVLNNHRGGRIDLAIPAYYPLVVQFDENKAYLHHSRLVPSPYLVPVARYRPGIDSIFCYPTGFWHVRMLAVDHVAIHPIQIGGRRPVDGEVFDMWLWREEIEACLEYGYQLLNVEYGYGFRKLTNFLEPWSDLLWDLWVRAEGDDLHIRRMIKAMMVGLPGRFLRQPEIYKIHPTREAQKGDIPLVFHWKDGQFKVFSDWVVRPEYDHESTALSPIGSYIVMKMRMELYERMRDFERNGHRVISTYIDCIRVCARSVDGISSGIPPLGSHPGSWKAEELRNVYVEENRLIAVRTDKFGWEEDFMKAPGFDRERRILFWQKYRRMQHENTRSL